MTVAGAASGGVRMGTELQWCEDGGGNSVSGRKMPCKLGDTGRISTRPELDSQGERTKAMFSDKVHVTGAEHMLTVPANHTQQEPDRMAKVGHLSFRP